jgi:hypothetical protein
MRAALILLLAACFRADAAPPEPPWLLPDASLTPEDYAARRQVSTCPEIVAGTDEIQLTRSRVLAARTRIDALPASDRLEARRAADL